MLFILGLFVGIFIMRLFANEDSIDRGHIAKPIEGTKTQNRITYKGEIYYRNKR